VFFKHAIDNNGFPKKDVMDKSGANYARMENINLLLMLAGTISFVEILQITYLNNLVGQTFRQNRYRLPVNYESQQLNAA
jgi:putative transposase